jgi:AcrR family transcriptional regulator
MLREGRRLYLEGGLSALSLSRLTQTAGVAKTSFYAFFPSKEDLLLDLLAAEAPGFSARVMAPLEDQALSAGAALSKFLHALLAEYRANPFLARLVAEPQTLAAIAMRVRPEDLERKSDWMERPLAAFFAARMSAGEIPPHPIETLMDVVRSVALLSLHRNRYGSDERFEAAAGALIALVADGLTRQETGS